MQCHASLHTAMPTHSTHSHTLLVRALLCRWKGGSYRNCKLALTMTTALLQRQQGGRGVVSGSTPPPLFHTSGLPIHDTTHVRTFLQYCRIASVWTQGLCSVLSPKP